MPALRGYGTKKAGRGGGPPGGRGSGGGAPRLHAEKGGYFVAPETVPALIRIIFSGSRCFLIAPLT